MEDQIYDKKMKSEHMAERAIEEVTVLREKVNYLNTQNDTITTERERNLKRLQDENASHVDSELRKVIRELDLLK